MKFPISNFKYQISNKKGFSVLEVILAAALFVMFSAGAITVVVSGYNANRLGSEFTVANQFVSEGIEAVRSIKNQSFSNLINTNSTGVDRVGNVWAFGGANDTLIHNTSDDYTRVIKVEDVLRDCEGNMVTSGGTADPDMKKITSTVNWNFNSARPESLSMISYLADWEKPIPQPSPPAGPIMMAYSQTTSIPYYRIWNGSSWGAEAQANSVGSGNVNFVRLKSSRTRNEAILATQDSDGRIYTQVWNGTSWGAIELMGTTGSNINFRIFDLEYEKNGDRAVIAYHPVANSADFAYRVWDGSSWSSDTTITAPPTTGVVRWIEMAASPISTSNDIAMIMLDTNLDVYGMLWNGTSWDDMGVTSTWDTTAGTTTGNTLRKAVDVAYEQNSGDVMFIWADDIATDMYYRIWDGSTLSSNQLLDIPAAGVGDWVRLVPRLGSDELMFGVQDLNADLNTRKWSGSSWDNAAEHPQHDDAVENISGLNFDIVWETYPSNSGKAWLVWGDGATVSTKQWSGCAWGSNSVLTDSDDTNHLVLAADPVSGAIFALMYESNGSATDDIWESHLTGGGSTWNPKTTPVIWDGPTTGIILHRIDFGIPEAP